MASADRTRVRRTRRDWAVDLGFLLFSVCFAAVSSQSVPVADDVGPVWQAVDQVIGGLGCAAVLLRRRWPVPLAVVLLLAGTQAHFLTGPTMVAVFTVAAARTWRETAGVAALAFAPLPLFLWRLPDLPQARADVALTYFALIAGAIGWGLFRRSRQQLIVSLRERAELAEAELELRGERARREARAEIAREMHDILGHRLSLLSVHAGALEFNPDAPPAEIARAAGVIRESARLALSDLAEVIGVLREASPPSGRPQPDLADIPRLVAEARASGERIELTGPASTLERSMTALPPASVGRTAYRIVQEALTNARKHAPGAAVSVRVGGSPSDRLTVEVHNGPAITPDTATAAAGDGGGGQGLIGLAERARLAGGELIAAPAGDGFRVSAWLPWPARDAIAEPEAGQELGGTVGADGVLESDALARAGVGSRADVVPESKAAEAVQTVVGHDGRGSV